MRAGACAIAAAAGLVAPGAAAAQAPNPPPLPVPVPLLPPGAEPSPGSPAPPPPPPPGPAPSGGCRGAWVGPIGRPGRGVSTTALGRAPAPYEVGRPIGRRSPRGVMLLVHGGGWYLVGPGPLSTERGEALRWRRRGWLTVNLDYPPCGGSLAGVLWFHDRVRRRHGHRVALCASGASAGGHLALLLAARRRGVDCVIARGAPTDLRTLGRARSGSGSREGPRGVARLATSAFGPRRLAAMSPVAHAGRLRARLLLAVARRDEVIPRAQAGALRRAVRRRRARAHVESLVLRPGRVPWIHARVSRRALARLHAAELRLVAPLLRRR